METELPTTAILSLLFSPKEVPIVPVIVTPLAVTRKMTGRDRVPRQKAVDVVVVAFVALCPRNTGPGIGIVVAFSVAPPTGAATGLLLARECRTAPRFAYAGGTMGTLLGADLFNLTNPDVLVALAGGGTTTLSIGGAGIFDDVSLIFPKR